MVQQNASRDSWSFEQTEIRLAVIMKGIHDACYRLVGQMSLDPGICTGAFSGFWRTSTPGSAVREPR